MYFLLKLKLFCFLLIMKVLISFTSSFSLPFFFNTIISYDKVSVYMILLTQLLFLCIFFHQSLMMMFLIFSLCLSFSVNNFFFFFFCLELSLIPVMLMMLSFGNQPERMSASYYIFFYTMISSVPFLLVLLFYYWNVLSIFFYNLIWFSFIDESESVIFSVFFLLVFLVKYPLFGLHVWLTKAHLEAPVSGSMLLAGMILKLGGYGLYRISKVSQLQSKYLFSWVLVSVIFVSMICLGQTDMKLIIAYSSVVHMGVLLVSSFLFKKTYVFGFVLLCFAHGMCSSGLFFCFSMMYEQTYSRNMLLSKGFKFVKTSMLMFWFLLCGINSSLPPFLNFFSELVLFNSIVNFKKLSLFFIFFFVFLSGLYNIYLFLLLYYNKWNNMNLQKNKVSLFFLLMKYFHFLIVVGFLVFFGFFF